MSFTKSKFLKLTKKQQHKHLASLLRELYIEMSGWIGEEVKPPETPEEISNRHARHLQEAGWHLKEHDLLPIIQKGDKGKALAPWPITIYLDHIRSAHNVGSILRTIEAFSLGKVFLSEDTPGIEHSQVKNTSMGTWDKVSCEKVTDFQKLPRPWIALETCQEAKTIYDFPFPKEFTLILGNEEYGVSQKLLSACDAVVTIPMRGRKNSLNVANAFAAIASEIVRQRSS